VRDVVPPIFLFSDDVESFESVELMLRHVEPWDVSDEMRAFDSVGRRLKLRAEGVVRTRRTVGGGRTLLDWTRSDQVAAAELATLLREYVLAVGHEQPGLSRADLDAAPLSQLVAFVAPRTRVR
jgi:hypothetical protein